MRFSTTVWSLCFLFAPRIAAQGLDIGAVPPCALACLIQTAPVSGCAVTDTKCQCASRPFLEAAAICLRSNCTMAEALILSKFTAVLCNKPEDQSKKPYIRAIVLGGLSLNLISAVGRGLSRWRLHGKFFLDDWLIVGAVGTTLVLTGLVLTMLRFGLGIHIYQVTVPAMAKLLIHFFFSYIVYIILTVLVKVSLLVFYLRLFPQRNFRIACWILLAYIISSSTGWTLAMVFQCLPVSSNWDVYVKDPHCRNVLTIQYIAAALHISQNLLILIVPLPIVVKLKVDLRKKLSLIAMFSLGAFVILCTCIRLQYFHFFGTTIDPSWDNAELAAWTAVEIDVAIICCNLPAIGALVQYLWTQKKTTPRSQSVGNDPHNKAPFRSIHSMFNENGERVERESIFEVQALPTVMTGPKRGFGLGLLKPLSRPKLRPKKPISGFPEPWELKSGHVHDRTEVTITSFVEPRSRISRKKSITQLRSRADSRSRDRKKLKRLPKSDEFEQRDRLEDMKKRLQEEGGAPGEGILITIDVAVDSSVIATVQEDRQLGSQERLFCENPR